MVSFPMSLYAFSHFVVQKAARLHSLTQDAVEEARVNNGQGCGLTCSLLKRSGKLDNCLDVRFKTLMNIVPL